jgi:hypothetical protein
MMSEQQPRRYQIPTHLGTPDKLDVPLLGITISLTMRQGVCFLLGGGLVVHLWEQSSGLVGVAGFFAHEIGPFLLAFVTYVLAVQEIHGRHLEEWGLVLVQYLSHPRVFVWCRVLEEHSALPAREETEEAQAHRTILVNEEEEG